MRRPARACVTHTQSMCIDEESVQNLDLSLCWISQHGHLLEAFVHMHG